MTLSLLTPYAVGDANSNTTRTAVMPTVANGDGAILAIMSGGSSLVPTLTPESGWTSPWTLVVNLGQTGKSLSIYRATNLSVSDSGKITNIGTSPTSLKMSRLIIPIRGASPVNIVDTYATSNGTSLDDDAATPPVATLTAGCGALHIIGMRRNDGVAGDWFTTIDPYPSGQGVTEAANAFSSTALLGASLNCIVAAYDWTPRALGATIPAVTFRADKTGTYYGITLAIRAYNVAPVADAGPDVEVDAGDIAYITDANATDSDGTVASTDWTWVSSPAGVGTGPTITDDDILTPSFTTTTPGEYKLRLTVEDNEGATHADDVSVWAVTTTPKIRAITAAGGWTAVGAGDIVTALGDSSDSTWARSAGNPAGDTLIGELEPVPAGAKGFTTTVRNTVNSPLTSCAMTLINRDTGTTIATKTETGLTTTNRVVTWDLSDSEDGAVVDSHKMNIRFVATTGA